MLFGLRMVLYVSPLITGFFVVQGDVVPLSGTIESGNILALTLFVLCTCIALFALREHRRLYYGALEMAFAFILIWSAALKIGALHGAAIAATTFGNDSLLALGAAIYVGVRALDNLGQGMDRYPTVYRLWLWLFLYSDDEAEAKIEAATQTHEIRAQLIQELAAEGKERLVRKHMPTLDTPEQK